jgi:hypothetical protein
MEGGGKRRRREIRVAESERGRGSLGGGAVETEVLLTINQ